jgi:hypothetical protein
LVKGFSMQLGWLAVAGARTGIVPGASTSQVSGLGRNARAINTAAEVTETGAAVRPGLMVATLVAAGAGLVPAARAIDTFAEVTATGAATGTAMERDLLAAMGTGVVSARSDVADSAAARISAPAAVFNRMLPETVP